MNDTTPAGWCKPQRKRTLEELQALIDEKRAELSALQVEAYNLVQGPRLEAIAEIRNIMRAQDLTITDILGPSLTGKRSE